MHSFGAHVVMEQLKFMAQKNERAQESPIPHSDVSPFPKAGTYIGGRQAVLLQREVTVRAS
jgi:hypothetical protein